MSIKHKISVFSLVVKSKLYMILFSYKSPLNALVTISVYSAALN